MARVGGFNNAFNAGELAPGAWSRSDLAQHAQGMALGLNLIGTVTGPACRATGTWWMDTLTAQGILIPFARDPDDAQLIVMSALKFTVYYADGSPVLDGPDPLEVEHDWTLDDLAKLRFEQSGDIIIITHRDGDQPQRRIRRNAPDDWQIDDYDYKNGPWRAENLTRTFTIAVAGTATVCTEDSNVGNIAEGVSVTLTASADLFDDPGHVGALFRLRQNDGNHGSESWTPRPAVKIGQFVLSPAAGRIYRRVAGGPKPSADTGGLTAPIHESGIVSDGRYNFEFMNDGSGVVEITAVTSATSATALVKRPIPLKSGQATSYWSEGAWSEKRGYPSAKPAFREERLVLAATPSEPDKFYGSRTAGFTADDSDFTPGLGTGLVVDSDAVTRFAGDAPCRVEWLMSLPFLVAGTTAGPVLITGATIEEPIAPASTVARTLNNYAASAVPPVRAGEGAIYVQRGGSTLRELSINPDKGVNYRDLTVVAGHLGARGFAQLGWQGTENLCWARLGDGGLAVLVYHIEMNVYGMTRRVLAAGTDDEEAGAWTVESLAVLPGAQDTVWLIASRSKGGGTQRGLLKMAARDEGCFYDMAESYAGAAVGTVDGLDHLEGETVSALADGAEYRGLTVTGGEVTLPNGEEAAAWTVGLPYMSRFRSLPLDLGGPGASQGQRVRLEKGVVIVEGVECLAGTDSQARLERVDTRRRDEVDAPIPRRHSQDITFGGATGRDVRVVVETDCGYDLAIHAIRPVGGANA